MTIEIVLAILAIVGAALTAGKVVFSTEVKVEHLNSKVAVLEVRAKDMDALASEGKVAHFALDAQVDSIATAVMQKASSESVSTLQKSVDDLRKDIREGFAELAKRLDRDHDRH